MKDANRYIGATILAMAALVIGLATPAAAQRVVQVAQGFGTLNTAISGDTTAAGAQVDTNTVYELESGGIYLLDGSLEYSFPITIVAATGYTVRPKLIPGVPSGGAGARAFRVRGDVTLKGLYVTNVDELGGKPTRMFRISAADVDIRIDDCHLDRSAQTIFRFDVSGVSVFITNSIISHVLTDYNNGRGFDDRGNHIDSLVSVDNTWYNFGSRILRDGGGWIKYAKFDHNTIINTGRRVAEFGEIIELEYTNNLAVNVGFLGQDTLEFYQVVVDTLSDSTLLADGVTQTVTITNNNTYNDPGIAAAYPDSVMALEPFSPGYGTDATNIVDGIAFIAGHPSPVGNIATWWNTPDVAATFPDLDTIALADLDLGYKSQVSFTGATDNGVLGDRNWTGHTLEIMEALKGVPDRFSLAQNFPNPFNPSTVIRYDLTRAADVQLAIYNLLGQEVARLVNGNQHAGAHTATWRGLDSEGNSVSSGVYFYRLESEGFQQTRKMLLMR